MSISPGLDARYASSDLVSAKTHPLKVTVRTTMISYEKLLAQSSAKTGSVLSRCACRVIRLAGEG